MNNVCECVHVCFSDRYHISNNLLQYGPQTLITFTLMISSNDILLSHIITINSYTIFPYLTYSFNLGLTPIICLISSLSISLDLAKTSLVRAYPLFFCVDLLD